MGKMHQSWRFPCCAYHCTIQSNAYISLSGGGTSLHGAVYKLARQSSCFLPVTPAHSSHASVRLLLPHPPFRGWQRESRSGVDGGLHGSTRLHASSFCEYEQKGLLTDGIRCTGWEP